MLYSRSYTYRLKLAANLNLIAAAA